MKIYHNFSETFAAELTFQQFSKHFPNDRSQLPLRHKLYLTVPIRAACSPRCHSQNEV